MARNIAISHQHLTSAKLLADSLRNARTPNPTNNKFAKLLIILKHFKCVFHKTEQKINIQKHVFCQFWEKV